MEMRKRVAEDKNETKKNGIKTDLKKKKIEDKTKIDETLDLEIPSGTILCNCFTCGSPVCSPMNWKDLSTEGSSLGPDTMTAYQQKVRIIDKSGECSSQIEIYLLLNYLFAFLL